ncbi:MAG: peptidoglycan-N-acetylglucosamine deacetylase, partial [Actinomycetota bacterium]|nr:peptidoglycan-N-acetylglucosamine deacetylase [Actinomycetota bacterium]
MKPTACITFDHGGDLGPFFAVLDRHGVQGSFFLEGRHGDEDPGTVAGVVAHGHELGMHGWAHEPWAELAPDAERRLAERATASLTAAAGRPPVGFRAPGGARTERTAPLLQELGYRFDASLGDGMRPAVLDGGVAQVPFVWGGVDGAFYLRPEPAEPAEVREQWLAQLDRVAAEGGLFLTICHAEITGADVGRLRVLDEVVAA